MRLKGTVRNVVDLGAFVDIGLKHDGLLHKSQIRRLQTPITVGDVLDVMVLSIDTEQGGHWFRFARVGSTPNLSKSVNDMKFDLRIISSYAIFSLVQQAW